MTTGYVASKAIVVSRTSKFDRMVRRALKDWGRYLKSGLVVKAEVARFADQIAARPTSLHVQRFDVVSLSKSANGRSWDPEPIVLHEGSSQPLGQIVSAEASEYWVGSAAELERAERDIISSLARKVAERAAMCEAMMAAIAQADPDLILSAVRCDPATTTVELVGDRDDQVAQRLPPWIKVGPSWRALKDVVN